MAFIQGSPDRKQKNKELVQYETSFHGGSIAEAMICIKVLIANPYLYFNPLTSYIFKCFSFYYGNLYDLGSRLRAASSGQQALGKL